MIGLFDRRFGFKSLILFILMRKARPVLSCPYDINVSHQGYYVVLAAEPDRKVGVDVMQLTRPRMLLV